MQEKTVRERQARTAPQPFKGTEKMKSPSLMQFSRKAGNDGMLKTLRQQSAQESRQGLPEPLKSNLEAKSGFSMDDVVTHYNSDKPAQLSALAYTQGSDIYMAPGQEKTLGHEAWHVVQQKQGGVSATMQIDGVGVNDSAQLEREADIHAGLASESASGGIGLAPAPVQSDSPVVQRIKISLPTSPSDADLLNDMRTVQTANPGNQEIALDSTALQQYQNTGTGKKQMLQFNQQAAIPYGEIGVDEDIIFMGHGTDRTTNTGTEVGQAFLDPKMLAEIAYQVKKPDNWRGKIVLLGCSTGRLVHEVSKKYYELSGKKKSAEVYGPQGDTETGNGEAHMQSTQIKRTTNAAIKTANDGGKDIWNEIKTLQNGIQAAKDADEQASPDAALKKSAAIASLQTLANTNIPGALLKIDAAENELLSEGKNPPPIVSNLLNELKTMRTILKSIKALKYEDKYDAYTGLTMKLNESTRNVTRLYLTTIDFSNPTSANFTIEKYEGKKKK